MGTHPPWGRVIVGDARFIMPAFPRSSVDLSVWSPPYYVGKEYERYLATFDDWRSLLQDVVMQHIGLLKPGGFMAVNIGDILCFPDPSMPRLQANNVRGKRSAVTADDVRAAMRRHPQAGRRELAALLGCSEQTVQRRLQGNNVRGGRQAPGTKVLLTGGLLVEWAETAGLHLHDQRIWRKDPCWANCQWHSTSYRAVDEFEHVYVFWKPGETQYDRDRLTRQEWSVWGSRGVWSIPSVRRNDRHAAEFPVELVRRLIQLLSPKGGVVLDPFMGSGTTAVAAAKLGRRWAGIERDAAYAQAAEQRIRTESADLLQTV